MFFRIFIGFLQLTQNFRHFEKNSRLIAQIVEKLLVPKNVLVWMPEISCFRTRFRHESVHGRQKLLKSVWQDLYPNFPSIQDKLSQKTSLFVRCEILGLFGSTLAADHMYSRHNWGKFLQHVKTLLSQKGKTFFAIFIAFLQSTQSFAHFEKKFKVYSLNSWEVIGSEKCACLNARKQMFQNTLRQWNCSRETNTIEICLAEGLC